MKNQSFWHNKWESNEIGFHLSDVHPLLKKFYSDIFISGEIVFVPLCGKTIDMSFLQLKGKKVIGVELSDIAASTFFQEQFPDSRLSNRLVEQSNFKEFSAQSIRILVGDYFNLTPELLDGAKQVYDRASLIALPLEMRKSYVEKLHSLLPKASILLITLDYDQQKMSGPPFSVDYDEVIDLFSFAKVKQLHRKNIIDNEPRFKSKGLTSFYQTAYHISW